MTKSFKLFIIVFLASLPFWWGVNLFQENIEQFFYLRDLEKRPPIFLAQIAQNAQNAKVLTPKLSSQNLELKAEAAISVRINPFGKEQVIFQKNATKPLPLASLTKLMTALVCSEFYPRDQLTKISQAALRQKELTGWLRVGEWLSVEDLLHIMLIESSNDAAFALAEMIGQEGFVSLMNIKAKELNMEDSYFSNPLGVDAEDLDPYLFARKTNLSSARDLVKLVKYIIEKHPKVLEILSKKEEDLYLRNGVFHHTLKNTNELLGEDPIIIGGKTGYTEEAGGCLLLITKGKEEGSYFVHILLNSPDRFGEMKKLIGATNSE